MNNLDRYNKIFTELFNVDESTLGGNFNSSSIDSWNSIMHLNLVNNIEDEFGIMLESDDLLDFKSYERGKEILSKYEVVF